MTHEEMLELRREAEREFMQSYPNVVGVALGFKVRGGLITDDVALRVYVRGKQPVSSLRADEIVPSSYRGMPTDVLEVPRIVPDVDATPCADRAQHSPLVGGITVSTLQTDNHGLFSMGTLGCFVTLNGQAPPHNIGLVTCNHVFVDGHPNAAVGDTVYQPAWQTLPDGTINAVQAGANPIGTIFRLPPQANDASGSYVDAAAVKLNICISSWCHTNCGVSFANEIAGLAINGSNVIADVNLSPRVGDIVVKVGRTTGRTVGRITAVAFLADLQTGPLAMNLIEIQATSMQTEDNCGGALRFSAAGDSGAAVIDAQARLVGLLIGSDPGRQGISVAGHIGPALAALNAVAITAANTVRDNPAAQGMRARAAAVVNGRPNQTAQLRARFLASKQGQRIFALAQQHRNEVVHLVNHNRRVTVAWHRSQGPAFLGRCIENARDAELQIPPQINGVSRDMLVRSMARALTEHGSPRLQEAVAQHLDEVLAWVQGFDSLHELVDSLAAQPLAASSSN